MLDSYEQERLPVAQRLLDTTDRIFTLLVSDSWVAGVFRTRILARILARAMTDRAHTRCSRSARSRRSVSAIGRDRCRRCSPRLPEGAPQAGDRFPWLHLKLQANGPVEDLFQKLDDTRFNLLVFGQPAPVAEALGVGDLIRVHAIPEDPINANELTRIHLTGPTFYLLRPDGHVGLAGRRLDAAAVTRYLAEHHLRLDKGTAATGGLGLRVAA